jgi:D-arabinose 1-dehydrogenase-like Zn-dependent alcohol dehydrogenase
MKHATCLSQQHHPNMASPHAIITMLQLCISFSLHPLGTAFAFSVAALRYHPACPRWLLLVGASTALAALLYGIFHTVTALEWVTTALFLCYVGLLGADYTINARNEDPVEAIKKLGGADVAISLAVSPGAFEQAFRSLRRGGTLVFVALPADNYMQLPIFETVLNGINIVGSIVGTRLDLAEVFELHAAGKTRVIYDTCKLEDVNHSFEEIEQGRIPARLVFDMV